MCVLQIRQAVDTSDEITSFDLIPSPSCQRKLCRGRGGTRPARDSSSQTQRLVLDAECRLRKTVGVGHTCYTKFYRGTC